MLKRKLQSSRQIVPTLIGEAPYNFGSDGSPSAARSPLIGDPGPSGPGGGSGPILHIPEGLVVGENIYYGKSGLTANKGDAKIFDLSNGDIDNINITTARDGDLGLPPFTIGGLLTSRIDLPGNEISVKITAININTNHEILTTYKFVRGSEKYKIPISTPGAYIVKYEFDNNVFYLNNGYLVSDVALANVIELSNENKSVYGQDVYYKNIFPARADGYIRIAGDNLPVELDLPIILNICDINGVIIGSYSAYSDNYVSVRSTLSRYYLSYEIDGYRGYVGKNGELAADFNNLEPIQQNTL